MTSANVSQAERDAARAAFILDEALKLGIRVGAAHDGSELTIVTPPGLGRGLGMTFSRALNEVREAVMEHILVKNGVRR